MSGLAYGPHAARPVAGLTSGDLYLCTTHRLVYQTVNGGRDWASWGDLMGGDGGGVSVTDGTTTVSPATEFQFPGGTVVDLGDGIAGVSQLLAFTDPISIETAAGPRFEVTSPDDSTDFTIGDNGEVTVFADDVPLTVAISSQHALQVDADGKTRLTPAFNVSSGQPALAVDAATAIANLLRLRTASTDVLTVGKDGTATLAMTGNGTLTVSGPLGSILFSDAVGDALGIVLDPGATFAVYDRAFGGLFRVDADGTVHIKTGTLILADL